MGERRDTAIDRVASRPEVFVRRRPRSCEVCGAPTNDGKPCCADHVECMPYVGVVMSAVAAYELEVEATNLGKAFREGVLLGELVVVLSTGAKSVPRIARDLRLTKRGAAALVRLAARSGLVETSRGRKGETFASLIKEGS